MRVWAERCCTPENLIRRYMRWRWQRQKAPSGHKLAPSRVLAVGDSVRTDLKGAHAMGLDFLFVTSGIHAEELGSREEPDHAVLSATFAAAGGMPKAVIRELRW